MQVLVTSFGPSYKAEITRMIRLFVPQVVVTFQDEKEVQKEHEQFDMLLETQVAIKEFLVIADVVIVSKDIKYTRTLEALDLDEVVLRKMSKRALLYALHVCLAKLFNKTQPWGILTGVRPSKLVHQQVRNTGRLALLNESARLQTEYLLAPSRADLLVEVAKKELEVVPDLYDLTREVSVYVGIPFCPTHCAYCTFPAYSMVDKARYAQGFLAAMIQEMKALGDILREFDVRVTSVYIGGGTPTSLQAFELGQMLEAIHKYIPSSGSWRELSVEAGRADTITKDRVRVMRSFGVNRISVNPQTFTNDTLQLIGRGHRSGIVPQRFALCRDEGFENINMDLILGLPGEELSNVMDSVSQTLALQPDAVTLHTLSYKRTSAVNRERNRFSVADDDTIKVMMQHADQEVRHAGLEPYYLYRQKDILANLENIGYSFPGKEGVYNICIIEEAQTIVGIGGGSASKWVMPDSRKITSHQNPREPSVYVETINRVIENKSRMLRSVLHTV